MDKINTNVERVRREINLVFRAQQDASWKNDRTAQEEKLQEICSYTYENFPVLWRGCLRNEPGTRQQLETMLNVLEQIQSGKQDKLEAEKKLGYQIFDTWAKPQLAPQEAMDYEKLSKP
jgi:hypothetical protein